MYQSKNDWLNLYENHKDLFFKAMEYEKKVENTERKSRFGWNCDMALEDMIKPENMQKIRNDYKNLVEKKAQKLLKEKKDKNFFGILDIDSFE